jgi:hypothetical protein
VKAPWHRPEIESRKFIPYEIWRIAVLSNSKKGINDFTKSIGLNSKFVDADFLRGCSCNTLKQHENVVAGFTKAIDLKADVPVFFYFFPATSFRQARGRRYQIHTLCA